MCGWLARKKGFAEAYTGRCRAAIAVCYPGSPAYAECFIRLYVAPLMWHRE
jgi:hypothetical protein